MGKENWMTVRVKALAGVKRLLGRESYESIHPGKSQGDATVLASRADIRDHVGRISAVLDGARGGACV